MLFASMDEVLKEALDGMTEVEGYIAGYKGEKKFLFDFHS